MMYCLTITERTPTPPEQKETHTYHVICEDLFEVADKLENLELNFVALVSATVTPWRE